MTQKKNTAPGISFFEKNLTVWVVLCMIAGVLIGMFLPAIPEFLSRFEYANVSIPIGILIWLMNIFTSNSSQNSTIQQLSASCSHSFSSSPFRAE